MSLVNHAHGSLTPAVISHQLIGKAVQCPKNIPIYAHISDNLPSTEAPWACVKVYLHHPPVRYRVHWQLPVEDPHLKNRHPAEQADFEERQGEKVGFCGPPDCGQAVVARHWSDGEILEEDSKDKRKHVICTTGQNRTTSGPQDHMDWKMGTDAH